MNHKCVLEDCDIPCDAVNCFFFMLESSWPAFLYFCNVLTKNRFMTEYTAKTLAFLSVALSDLTEIYPISEWTQHGYITKNG